MTTLRRLVLRLASLFRSERLESELAREVDAHLTLLADDFERRGMTPDDARLAARRAFGGVEQTKDRQRDARSFTWLDELGRDVRYAARTLSRTPGFTVVAVLTLAIGIGVNTAVFTVTNAALFKGYRLIDNDRIAYITLDSPCCLSYPDFEDWRSARVRSFDGIGAVAELKIALRGTSGYTERHLAAQVSANTFRLLGQQPILGRDFTAADEAPGAAPVAILSYGFWERRYGKDPSIVGQVLPVEDALPATVIGVMPPDFSFPENQALWVPLVPTPDLRRRENRSLWFAFGRLADGATIESAGAEMQVVAGRLARTRPSSRQGEVPRLRRFTEFNSGANAALLYTSIWGASGFVLLITCANLTSLLLARAIGRSREIALRVALGAGRGRIVRQLLVESLVLSTIGGVFGWAMATWGVRAYALATNPPGEAWNHNLLDYTMDGRVFAYLVAISIGAGLLFGLVPALWFSRRDLNAIVKDGGRGVTDGRRGRRVSGLLVTGEVVLAVVLLAGAGVMIRSFLNIYTADLGIRTTDTLAMFLRLPEGRYARPEAQVSFFDRLAASLEAIPGVESTAIAAGIPTGGAAEVPYELAGAAAVDAPRRPATHVVTIGPGYFRTLGAAVSSGREFTDADGPSRIPAVVVNQRFASEHWPREAALGKRFRLFDGATPGPWLTVVGVVSNIVHGDPGWQQIDPVVYVPYQQGPRPAMWVFVRTPLSVTGLGPVFRRAVNALDPSLPIEYGPNALAERMVLGPYANGSAYGKVRNHAALFGIFAAMALLLAWIGIYATVAHAVSQHTQEIGIRLAIGATSRDVLRLVFRQGLAPVAIGLAVGVAASFVMNRVLNAELVQVSPNDPLTLAVAATMLAAAAVLGCWFPARRAMHVDPIVALRIE